VNLTAGVRMLLVDLNRIKATGPRIVAASCRLRDEKVDGKTLQFRADGIAGTNSILQIVARTAPAEILIGGQPLERSMYDFSQGMARVRFPNSVEPVSIEVHF
jgi:hypothetical protein